MKSHLISKSETTALLKEVSEEWKIDIPKIKNLKIHKISDEAELVTGEGIKILKMNERHIPFLSETQLLEKFPYVMVDMGAVKFMCNGANVMRPGIKSHTDFKKGDIVCIIEESQHKFLAVGRASYSSEEIDNMDKGQVIENLHYISDKFWEIAKTISD